MVAGFGPRDMDDKWIVCAKGPNGNGRAVDFCQSWTRNLIAEIKVREGEKKRRMTGVGKRELRALHGRKERML